MHGPRVVVITIIVVIIITVILLLLLCSGGGGATTTGRGNRTNTAPSDRLRARRRGRGSRNHYRGYGDRGWVEDALCTLRGDIRVGARPRVQSHAPKPHARTHAAPERGARSRLCDRPGTRAIHQRSVIVRPQQFAAPLARVGMRPPPPPSSRPGVTPRIYRREFIAVRKFTVISSRTAYYYYDRRHRNELNEKQYARLSVIFENLSTARRPLLSEVNVRGYGSVDKFSFSARAGKTISKLYHFNFYQFWVKYFLNTFRNHSFIYFSSLVIPYDVLFYFPFALFSVLKLVFFFFLLLCLY